MAEGGEETDKSEDASAFKLDRARRKGMLARGTDIGFLAALIALAISAELVGENIVAVLAAAMHRNLAVAGATKPGSPSVMTQSWAETLNVAGALAVPLFLLLVIVGIVELIQNRGFVFSFEPLKPDFSRLNPAKGLKRIFSIRLLKELAKNLLKFTVYAAGAFLYIKNVVEEDGLRARDGRQLAEVIGDTAGGLLLLFIFLAAAMALIDQLIARREFARQMRMSRREITREHREREGEPRQKQKRRQILGEIIKQAAAAANVKGADVLIVNPTHYAVALRYRPEEGNAPIVQARGRNLWARRMRDTARREGIVIVRNPALARALYNEGQIGRPIGQANFVPVADIYIALQRALREASKP